jgi:hypothetical protein
MASRYGITKDDLRAAARSLQIAGGIAQRFDSGDVDQYIEMGEDWAEAQISDYLVTPLKPTPAPGMNTVPSEPTKRNFPREFILAATYWATALLIQSEFTDSEPNISGYGEWASAQANGHIEALRGKPTIRVGAGRRRNPNPFTPPHLTPPPERRTQ